jgi:phosphatidylglycerophosphate synthase
MSAVTVRAGSDDRPAAGREEARKALRDGALTAVAGALLAGLLAGWAAVGAGPRPAGAGQLALAVAVGAVPPAAAARSVLRRRPRSTTPADRVTLVRVVLVGGCAALAVLVVAGALPPRPWPLLLLAVPALVLDAVDGWVSRRTGRATPAGARLDMEVDAAALLVLSAALTVALGPWVLAVGLARYAFVAASWLRPALRGPLLPPRLRRPVAGLQAAALGVALGPPVPVPLAASLVGVALALLVVSFGRDVAALERRTAGPGVTDRRRSPRPPSRPRARRAR